MNLDFQFLGYASFETEQMFAKAFSKELLKYSNCLPQLCGYYLRRNNLPIFQSVILAGVYDVKNVKKKLRPDDAHKTNSPWNIAADFNVEMSFSIEGIAGMLRDYEADHLTRMNIDNIVGMIYDYTSGYPYLVSRICKLIDENLDGNKDFPTKADAWTKSGLMEAVV